MRSWEKFEVDFTHFQENNGMTHVSVLDHFFWNEITGYNVKEAGVIHHCDNLSDHSPIYCLMDVDITPTAEVITEAPPVQGKPSWKRASKEQKDSFPAILNEKLSSFSTPDMIKNCTDVKCRDVNHCEKADEFISNILECIEVAAAETLPTPKAKSTTDSPSRSKVIPGWKTFVKPFRDKAFFWHQVWTSAGRPLNTTLHNIMKKTRNVYHFHYRKCKKAQEMIIKNKLLDACINGNGNIFDEIKKLRN